jgi:membrane protease YdiL (CAAX protease family)
MSVPAPPGAPRRLLAEVLVTFLVTLLVIRLDVSLFSGVLWDLPLALVPVLFMWVPVWVLRQRGEDPDQYPLALPMPGEDREVWTRALREAGLVILVITAPFIGVYHLWQTGLFPALLDGMCGLEVPGACYEARRAAGFGPAWRLPDEPLKLVFYHLFFVAIPEEMFYRGYMQSRLEEHWAPRWRVFGAQLGPGWLLTCLIFAFGHSLVIFQWWHFAIFFPSLVFGWLRARTGHVLAGAFFHAWCNVLVAFLDAAWGVTVPGAS